MEEPTFHELEYLKMVEKLAVIVEDEEKYESESDFNDGFSRGKLALAKDLLIDMQTTVISWNY